MRDVKEGAAPSWRMPKAGCPKGAAGGGGTGGGLPPPGPTPGCGAPLTSTSTNSCTEFTSTLLGPHGRVYQGTLPPSAPPSVAQTRASLCSERRSIAQEGQCVVLSSHTQPASILSEALIALVSRCGTTYHTSGIAGPPGTLSPRPNHPGTTSPASRSARGSPRYDGDDELAAASITQPCRPRDCRRRSSTGR